MDYASEDHEWYREVELKSPILDKPILMLIANS
jgi:hypothetical protein